MERAAQLFNDGRYHEAADAFEDPYHARPRTDRAVLLALIRASAALYHFAGGRFHSARRLYRSSRELLTAHGPTAESLDLGALVDALDLEFRPVVDAPDDRAAELRPTGRPQLVWVSGSAEVGDHRR